MAYKVVKYLLDDSVSVVNPKFFISVSLEGRLLKELGSHVIIKDDIILAAFRVLKEERITSGKCRITISEVCGEDLTYKTLVDFDFNDGKLKGI